MSHRHDPKRMINIAGPLLDDQTVLDLDRTWVRNGKHGNLHLHKFCRQMRNGYTFVLTMSLRQAAKHTICDTCFEPTLGDPALLAELHRIFSTKVQLDGIRGMLDATPAQDIAANGALAKQLGRYRDSLVHNATAEISADAYKTLLGEFDELAQECSRRLAGGAAAALIALATETMVARTPNRHWNRECNVPEVTVDHERLFGEAVDDVTNGLTRVSELWRIWCDTRIAGGDAAAVVTGAAAHSLLTDLAQLEGVRVDLASGDLAAISRRAWLSTIDTTIRTLCDAWEKDLTGLLELAETPTVSVVERVTQPNRRRSEGLTHWCLRTGQAVEKGGWILLRSNALIDAYLEGNVGDVTVITGTVSDAEFETVAAIWDPLNDASSYTDAREAYQAARALNI